MKRTIEFLRKFDYISEFEENVILHCRKSVLIGRNGTVWQKKDSDFDVTMGSFDGAEIAESVGLYLLDRLSSFTPKELMGLYRDDGLTAVRGSPSDVERLKKKIFALFKEEGLRITAESGAKTVDFLDVIMNLNDGSYHPYVKPNTKTKYVSVFSNHPKQVLKQIPEGVCKRLSNNSSSEAQFVQHTAHFGAALKEAGYTEDLKYKPSIPQDEEKRKRRRKVIWFNPPWSQNIKTDIIGRFLTLVRKHFKKGSTLYHLFNTKKLKASYSTGPNMKQLIASHNCKVLLKAEGREPPTSYGCNCIEGVQACPLQGECKTPSLVYQAEVKVGQEQKFYIGQTANTFKTRFNGHNSDINCGRVRTEYCSHMIDLIKKGVTPDSISWSKILSINPRSKGDKTCSLCLSEKVFIAKADRSTSLNERSEIMRRCRHRDKLILTNNLSLHHQRRTGSRRARENILEEELQRTPQNNEEEDSEDQLPEDDQGDTLLESMFAGERQLRRRRTNDYTRFF